MRSDDLSLPLSGVISGDCGTGQTSCSKTGFQASECNPFSNSGYRWFQVNELIYVYTITSLTSFRNIQGFPETEVLAHVQRTTEPGMYRAINYTENPIEITYGSLKEIQQSVEKQILKARLHFKNTIREGLGSTDEMIHFHQSQE